MAKNQAVKPKFTRKDLLVLAAIGAGIAILSIILVVALDAITHIARFLYEGRVVPTQIFGTIDILSLVTYLIIIFGVAGLAALTARWLGYKNTLAAAVVACCTTLFLITAGHYYLVVHYIELAGYVVYVVLAGLIFVAGMWACRRINTVLALTIASVIALLSPTLQLTAAQISEGLVSDDTYFTYTAKEAQKENPFDAHVYANGNAAEFKDQAWPYVEQQFALNVDDSNLNLIIRQNVQDGPSEFEISADYCQIKDYFEVFNAQNYYNDDGEYEYTGCQQVATTQQNEPVYTEPGAVGSHKDSKGYATRYYYLQHDKSYIVVKASVTGSKVGQDPSAYLDQIVSTINSLQKVSSTSLKASAAY